MKIAFHLLRAFVFGFMITAVAVPTAAVAATPLERYLKSRGYKLPSVVRYHDFYKAALEEGIVDSEKFLKTQNIPIVGTGDGRYVRTSDLLKSCGIKCNYHKGWGIFISQFAVQVHRK